MANLQGTLRINLTYQGPGDTTVNVAQKTINFPYQGSSVGQIDIPADVADSDPFDVPVGSIGDGITGGYLVNGTTQDLEVKYNGGAVTYELPPGGVHIVAATAIGALVPLKTITLVATGTALAVERVDFFLFGDPTP